MDNAGRCACATIDATPRSVRPIRPGRRRRAPRRRPSPRRTPCCTPGFTRSALELFVLQRHPSSNLHARHERLQGLNCSHWSRGQLPAHRRSFPTGKGRERTLQICKKVKGCVVRGHACRQLPERPRGVHICRKRGVGKGGGRQPAGSRRRRRGGKMPPSSTALPWRVRNWREGKGRGGGRGRGRGIRRGGN